MKNGRKIKIPRILNLFSRPTKQGKKDLDNISDFQFNNETNDTVNNIDDQPDLMTFDDIDNNNISRQITYRTNYQNEEPKQLQSSFKQDSDFLKHLESKFLLLI